MENTYDSKMDRGGNSGGGERLNMLCTQSGQDGNRGGVDDTPSHLCNCEGCDLITDLSRSDAQ